MRLRGWVRRLEREAREGMIEIPQQDGTVTCFPQSAQREAYVNLMARLGAGEDAPPEHPLIVRPGTPRSLSGRSRSTPPMTLAGRTR